ncbi:MAG TPA: DoxX family protein [Segetibacter sp.]|jgi:putative oxidoreductase
MRRTFNTQINNNAINIWLLISRFALGAFMMTHGYSKLQMLLSGNVQFADPFGIGQVPSLALTVFAEFVCALLLVIGLATRLATVPLIITMLVAIFYAHGSDPFAKKELAVVYLVVFIGFLVLGPGRYSFDTLVGRKSRVKYS